MNFDKHRPQIRRRVPPALPHWLPTSPRYKTRSATAATVGFTLVEVLVVLAIIGVLTAILITTASGVRDSAAKAHVKVQFTQWAAAIEAFRSEYGHYPQFDAAHKVNGGAANATAGNLGGEHLFHDILAGRRRDGQPLGPLAAAQNRRHIRFYSFGANEFSEQAGSPSLIQDALGNTVIAVLVDRNLDGRIDAADYPALPAVATRDGILIGAPTLPPSGLPVSVAFYSAGPGATAAAPEFVVSW